MMAKRKTKAEREAAEREAIEAARHAALAWPNVAEPVRYSDEKIRSLASERGIEGPVRAWTFNTYAQRVTQGCFTAVSHATAGAKTTSQTCGGPWFETRDEAEIALWWACCRRYASELMKVARIPSDPA